MRFEVVEDIPLVALLPPPMAPPPAVIADRFGPMSGITNGATTAITAASIARSPATARATGLRETTSAETPATTTPHAIAVITHHGQPTSTVSATGTPDGTSGSFL